VWKVSKNGSVSILHNFDDSARNDGALPYSGVIMDANAEGDASIPPTPGEDEVVVVQPDVSINTDEDKPRKIYVDGVGATIVAERVEYLDERAGS